MFKSLLRKSMSGKHNRPVFLVRADRLSLVKFALEDIEAERIENLFLNHAFERTRPVNGIVTFASDERLGPIGKLERDLLLLQAFGQTDQVESRRSSSSHPL